MPRGRVGARIRLRGVYLIVSDEYAPPAECGRGMHKRLRPRARRVEREPETPQPARGRPPRRRLAIPHGEMLGKPSEQYIPALVTGRVRHNFEQPQTSPGGSWWYSLRNSTTSRHCESKARQRQDEPDWQESSAGNSHTQSSESRVDHIRKGTRLRRVLATRLFDEQDG